MKKRWRLRRNRFEVRYVTDPEDPDAWLTLDQIREKLPKSNWRHSRILEFADVATEAGFSYPEGFLALTDNEKAYLLATTRAKRTMRAFDEMQAEKSAKSAGKKI